MAVRIEIYAGTIIYGDDYVTALVAVRIEILSVLLLWISLLSPPLWR